MKGPQSLSEIMEQFSSLSEIELKNKLEKLEDGGAIEQSDSDDGTKYGVTESGAKLKPLLVEMKD